MEVGEQTVTTDGNNVIINSDVTYENKTANVELIANTKTSAYESMAFNINYTMGEKMEQAGSEHSDGSWYRIPDADFLKLPDQSVQAHQQC